MFGRAMEHNLANIRATANTLERPVRLLDLGCADGETTLKYAPRGGLVYGLEYDHEAARKASEIQIRTVRADLNRPLPFEDSSFDVVTSNQVIEHLADTDMMISEGIRVLCPGGILVVSTENMSSWHNIIALMMGWQAFSLTNVSFCAPGIGNPLANTRGQEANPAGYYHLRIFSYRGLKELFELHGLSKVRVLGAGYYPFPTILARWDPRHSAFITAIGIKPDA